MNPFVVFALPRSRTAWLSKFLTYDNWTCGHDELRHMRSLDDVRAWFSQPRIGTVETAGAAWWRLLDTYAPEARIAIVRRPVKEVVDSLLRIKGVSFDRAKTERSMWKLERKLDQVERRLPNVLTVNFDQLAKEGVCAELFEHCLIRRHDRVHWARLDYENVQIDFPALVKYLAAYGPALEKLAKVAKHRCIAQMAPKEPVSPDGITFQTEDFRTWKDEGHKLFDEHLIRVGEAPGDWRCKNIPLMQGIDDAGGMQIVTARCNGRMFGYLVTLITPSLASESLLSGYNTTFYASPEFPGLGLKLQRYAAQKLRERGIGEVCMQAGIRGDGERIASLYRRLGAEYDGAFYRLDLKGA